MLTRQLKAMASKEKFFDDTMIANFLVGIVLVLSAIYYWNHSTEIEEEVKTVIVNSLKDVNNSLAEQESVIK